MSSLEAPDPGQRQRGFLNPHPLNLLQPLLILSQLGHECLVPEPSLVQLVAVFPCAVAPSASSHGSSHPAVQDRGGAQPILRNLALAPFPTSVPSFGGLGF